MATEVEISFDEIRLGDEIRTVRVVGSVTHTIQGVVLEQDSDGDWTNDDELITYHDGYDETYFRIRGELPTTPGSLVRYPSPHAGYGDVFALKLYGNDGWFLSFSDGSSGIFGDETVSTKDWSPVR